MCELTPAARVTLEKSLESPSRVRDFVEHNHCTTHGAQGMAALQLLASELVTNAVLYGGDPIWVELTCDVHTMRVEVHHGHREGEVVQGSDGMGMLLVNKVAHAWGTTPTEAGRAVWGTVATRYMPTQTPRSWEERTAARATAPQVIQEADSGAGARRH